MTAEDKIEALLVRNAGFAYCDDCLSEVLDIHPRQQVNQKTNNLAKRGRFRREKGECKHCKHVKLVIGTNQRKVA